MDKVDSAVRELLVEGVDDWVPIDRLIGLSREIASSEGGDFRSLAGCIIELLLSRSLMEVGEIGDSGFERWDGDAKDVTARVVAICESFNWEPFGEACWLANTERGSAQAQE